MNDSDHRHDFITHTHNGRRHDHLLLTAAPESDLPGDGLRDELLRTANGGVERVQAPPDLLRRAAAALPNREAAPLTDNEQREARYALDISEARQRDFRYPTPEAEALYGAEMRAGLTALRKLLEQA